jgi:GSCFA family
LIISLDSDGIIFRKVREAKAIYENPYSSLPDWQFWRRAVAALSADQVDPITATVFKISKRDKVATAGSCFAQYIAKTLSGQGFNYFVTEEEPSSPGALNENFGVFSARYANIYTVRQLLQLFERAYDLFIPVDQVWIREDGAYVDPFRPQIQKGGFETVELLEADRTAHLTAVRKVLENCDVFIFTLGLTEAWICATDGAVVPIAPGVAGHPLTEVPYRFQNMAVEEMRDDLVEFIRKLRVVNPGVRVVLTVSPVPLIATYENRHVLESTTYSKAALRVVAEMVTQQMPDVAYFPSYEVITGPHSGNRYFADDLRTITPEGVSHVMAIFTRHFTTEDDGKERARQYRRIDGTHDLKSAEEVVCEEELLDQ